MIKLLYIHQYFVFPEQNGGTRSYDLASSFVKKGIDVTVISSNTTPQSKNKKWEIFERDGIKFYMLNCKYNNKMSFYRRIYSFLYFTGFATFKALRINCDVILATSTPITIAFPAIIRKKVKKTPFVFEVRDVWPEVPIKMGYINSPILKFLLYKFEIYIYNKSTWIVPLSVGMRDNIYSRTNINKFTVIPNISEINRFQKITAIKQNISCNDKIVLYAGTIGEVNGLKYLVDLAYKCFNYDTSIKFHIYGEGKHKDYLIKYAEKLGVLNNNLFFKGCVSKDELPELYSSCTIGSSFVINNPILWDNSANKFFDSLAASKPILINHYGWQAETINKYNIGFVINPHLTDKAVLDFINYLNDKELLKTQSNNSLKLAKEEFSLEVAIDKYLEILRSIIK